ncbi:transmembrane protein 74 [Chanos chanos]|uniref:Transmembrane protein 74 n=1 Tax=Chanos chanos TaxID=29144 RepID=A0A6J2WM17_CHACN|nr:transmembrane protein 74-like [Chanos chanos]
MAELEPFHCVHENRPCHHKDFVCTSQREYSNFSTGIEEKAISFEYQCDFEWREYANEVQYNSVPWTAPSQNKRFNKLRESGQEVEISYDEESETVFTCQEDDINCREDNLDPPEECNKDSMSLSSSSDFQEPVPELSMLSDDDFSSESSGTSVDYGFISAVTFLVTGISLVVLSYTIPRDVKVSPDSVSAREMERLELESARVGAHLDRCVIAGLCLLTLGGVVLSTLLMISMYKGEMVRRQAFAYSRHSAKLYGSINFRGAGSPAAASSHLSLDEDDTPIQVPS